jgi:ferrochelatase
MNLDSVKTKEKFAVLLLGFGGPESEEAVRPFVEHVAQGRPISAERINQVIDQYKLIGGKSPFNQLTRRQADALSQELKTAGLDVRVYMGFLHSHPYIKDTIAELANSGHENVIACIMAPHRTEASFDRYVKAANQGFAQLNAHNLQISFLPDWHNEPLFVEAAADRIRNALDKLPPCQKGETLLVFTAHSVPQTMSDQSGYDKQINETAKLVAESLNHKRWQVAYQSRSGSPKDSWLGPDILRTISDAKQSGIESLIVMPIGFVCDHVEVLYDLDVQAKSHAEQNSINFLRAKTVQDHPSFISLLAQLVQKELVKAAGIVSGKQG